MSKKDFFIGMLCGVLVTVFLAFMFLVGRVLFKNARGNYIPEDHTQAVSTESNRDSQTESSEKTEKKEPEYDSILESPVVQGKIETLEGTIDRYYIEDVDQNVLAEGLYDGIMASLNDPYSVYYTPEEFQDLMEDTEGVYYGIGAYLQADTVTGYPKITGIIDNSPASESEMRVDDYILAVEGTDVYGMDLTDVVSLIKGPEGTDVTITFVRKSESREFDLTLTRRKVETPTVTYEMKEDNIAYISISQFDDVTVDQFAEAYATVIGQKAKGLVLDLRGNPGGSLGAVVDIAGMLLPEGTVVYTIDKAGNRTDYTSKGEHEITIPMVVLVNGGSASASEILAGAIKDYGKGTLLGTTTFGKGIVQRIFSYRDGSGAKLTVSHYYTPNGNDIHKKGVEPDEVLEFDPDLYYVENEEDRVDNQLDRAIEIIKEKIK